MFDKPVFFASTHERSGSGGSYATAVCCYVQGGTLCIPGTCDPYPVVCHGSSDCDGGTCCPLAKGSSFKVCTTGACP